MIAIVTGASRGVGKGTAIALGQHGGTVYVTGRSTEPDPDFGGSILETAAAITNAGGKGVAVVVDHAEDEQVADLFARIGRDERRLDILVNIAAKVASPQPGGFWEKPLEAVDLLTVGLRSHYVASWHAAPLMIANGRGLIVNIGHYGAVCYWQGPAYGAQKAGGDKMAADMAKELRPHGVAAISLWLGSVDTERARAYRAANGMAAATTLESPAHAGRVIAALYESDRMPALSGRALIAVELAAMLGVEDRDGYRAVSQRYTLGGPPEPHPSLR